MSKILKGLIVLSILFAVMFLVVKVTNIDVSEKLATIVDFKIFNLNDLLGINDLMN